MKFIWHNIEIPDDRSFVLNDWKLTRAVAILTPSFLYLLLEEYMTVKEMKKVLERLDDSYEIVVSIGSEYQFSFEDDDVKLDDQDEIVEIVYEPY